jgi:toxin ParE1/3/4
MPAFQLTNKAKSDLKAIARYTEKTWGLKQRNVYLSDLDECFSLLADSPDLGFPCDEIKQGYFKFYLGKHIIFFRRLNATTQIVRILHERMDIERHLM